MVHSFKTRFVIRILILICLLTVLPGGLALGAPGDTTRISIDSSGVQTNGMSFHSSISADGRYVAFHSSASNLPVGIQMAYWVCSCMTERRILPHVFR
jgi:hypothetical protein